MADRISVDDRVGRGIAQCVELPRSASSRRGSRRGSWSAGLLVLERPRSGQAGCQLELAGGPYPFPPLEALPSMRLPPRGHTYARALVPDIRRSVCRGPLVVVGRVVAPGHGWWGGCFAWAPSPVGSLGLSLSHSGGIRRGGGWIGALVLGGSPCRRLTWVAGYASDTAQAEVGAGRLVSPWCCRWGSTWRGSVGWCVPAPLFHSPVSTVGFLRAGLTEHPVSCLHDHRPALTWG